MRVSKLDTLCELAGEKQRSKFEHPVVHSTAYYSQQKNG